MVPGVPIDTKYGSVNMFLCGAAVVLRYTCGTYLWVCIMSDIGPKFKFQIFIPNEEKKAMVAHHVRPVQIRPSKPGQIQHQERSNCLYRSTAHFYAWSTVRNDNDRYNNSLCSAPTSSGKPCFELELDSSVLTLLLGFLLIVPR